MVQPKFNATNVEKYLELIELIGFLFGFPKRDENLIYKITGKAAATRATVAGHCGQRVRVNVSSPCAWTHRGNSTWKTMKETESKEFFGLASCHYGIAVAELIRLRIPYCTIM